MPLIYGFASGYNWENISLFVVSLRKNSYRGDLLMPLSIHKYKEMELQIKINKIIPIIIEEDWPFYSSMNKLYPIDSANLKKCMIEKKKYKRKWVVYRFSILLCWLLYYGSEYTHIISLDVRDIVFQGNPVEWNFEDGLYLADETKDNVVIKDRKWNLNSVKPFKNYEKIINNKILNSGSILGSNKHFISFLKQFCKFLTDNYADVSEQGSLNYAYYTGYFNNITFHINRNQKGVILTTAIDLNQVKRLYILNNTIYNEDLTIPLIVHQYERSKELILLYKQKYF